MQCGIRHRLTAGMVGLALLLTAGCHSTSEDIDVSERGILTLIISRVSESNIATATAEVRDNNILSFPFTMIALTGEQVLSVNSVPLMQTLASILGLETKVSATISAVDTPDDYVITFDDEGTETSYDAEPPEDFDEVAPADSTQVTRDGIPLVWEEGDDDDVTITVTITGQMLSYAADGTAQAVEGVVTLSGIEDDGSYTIGSASLSEFWAGQITVRLTRTKSISRKLGFASGTITLEIAKDIPLTLTDTLGG